MAPAFLGGWKGPEMSPELHEMGYPVHLRNKGERSYSPASELQKPYRLSARAFVSICAL